MVTSMSFLCRRIPAKLASKRSSHFRCNASNGPFSSLRSLSLFTRNNAYTLCSSSPSFGFQQVIRNGPNGSTNETKLSHGIKSRRRRRFKASTKLTSANETKKNGSSQYPSQSSLPMFPAVDLNSQIEEQEKVQGIERGRESSIEAPLNVSGICQNGDPLGRKDLGKSVVRWIRHSMRAMASDFASAEAQGEFSELRQRMGPGLTFVIQAQPYLNAVPMPLGLEVICLKACTHYPTLFDHFQRELRDVLQDLQRKSLVLNWCETESWKLLKELAKSAQHRAIARKVAQPKSVQGILGMDLEKVKAIQHRIEEFTKRMSELLRIERDAELEFTQEELDAVPRPDDTSDSSKPIEFLVSHGQAQQELCDTICNLNAISTSTGLPLLLSLI